MDKLRGVSNKMGILRYVYWVSHSHSWQKSSLLVIQVPVDPAGIDNPLPGQIPS